MKVTVEEGAGVFEVLFGVGLGGGQSRKRFVEHPHDPLLLRQRGHGQLEVRKHPDFDVRHSVTELLLGNRVLQFAVENEKQESWQNFSEV